MIDKLPILKCRLIMKKKRVIKGVAIKKNIIKNQTIITKIKSIIKMIEGKIINLSKKDKLKILILSKINAINVSMKINSKLRQPTLMKNL